MYLCSHEQAMGTAALMLCDTINVAGKIQDLVYQHHIAVKHHDNNIYQTRVL